MAINVTIWNENVHEKDEGVVGELVRKYYPNGIHEYLKGALQAEDLNIRAVSLDMPEQGLPEELLNSTDVLLWWGHAAHELVDDKLVDRIQARVQGGMGLIVLHSGHLSKIFRRMMGTSCRLRWREIGERERIWTIDSAHPIAQGIPETFALEHNEMYGEEFSIPQDGHIIFMSWYEGGNVFRSGITFQRDKGRIFYFSPGHETFPIYHQPVIQKILLNGIRWANPLVPIDNSRVTHQPEPLEKVHTSNPTEGLDLDSIHKTL